MPTEVYDDGATYPIYGSTTSPSAVYHAGTNKTWFTWEAYASGHRWARVRVYDHTAQTWSSVYTAAQGVITDDDHGVPSIMRDADGYWHVFHDAHVGPTSHEVTTNPEDPSAWTNLASILTTTTYPHPVLVGSTMYIFFRGGTGTLGDNGQSRYRSVTPATFSGGVATFGSTVNITDYGSSIRAYTGQCLASGTDIHIVGAPSPTSTPSVPYDVHHFVYRTTTGALANADGSTVISAGSLPIDLATASSSFRVFTADAFSGGDIPSMCLDSSGNPHIIWNNGPNGGTAFPVWHTAFIGGVWTTPYQLGISPLQPCQPGIVGNSDGSVDAYWQQQGSETFSTFGGDMYKARRTAAGTWLPSGIIQATAGKALESPSAVLNGRDDMNMLFTEVLQASLDSTPGIGTLKGYVNGAVYKLSSLGRHG